MSTKPLKRTIQGFRFQWEGGEYIEIIRVGNQAAFEVINVTDADGNIPEFTKAVFMAQIEAYRIDRNRHTRGWLANLRDLANQTYTATVR